jgi:glycosyltransferase involved in cell wall biosynthesis
MINVRPRLVVADPSLVDARGHHFTLTQQVTRGAQLRGVDVVWLTHKDFAAPKSPEGVSIHPVFSATMYDRYRPEIKNNLPSDLDRRLLEELEEGIMRSGLGAEDHIYFHTGFGDLYKAAHKYASSSSWRNKPYLHICTPYDLDTMPGKDAGTVLLDIFNSMRTIEAVDKKIFFWAETPQLAVHYTLTYGFNVRALPLPPPHKIKAEAGDRNSDAVTALYLGAAREEKGFLLLPEIVERLYEPLGRAGKIRFVIQCSPQIIGYLPSIKAAIGKLSRYSSSYVRLIDTVLDEQDYHSYLVESDVVLLLYHKKNYRIRGSGIAVEAVCADKCILTHKGTFCASLITHGGGGAVDDVGQAVATLADLVDKKNEYRQNAKLQGQQYRAVNSVESYVAKVMDQTRHYRAVAFFPSSIIGHVSPTLIRIRN